MKKNRNTMKAKIIVAKNAMEAVLENGVVIIAKKNEDQIDFETRVSEMVAEHHDVAMLDFVEINEKKLRTKSTSTLEASLKKITGLELKLTQEILETRGIVQKTFAEEVKPQPKVEKTEPLKKQISEDEILAKIEDAEINKYHKVTFLDYVSKKMETGVIKAVRLDKRSNFIMYRIDCVDANGNTFSRGKGIDDTTMEIGEYVGKPPREPRKEKEAKPVSKVFKGTKEIPVKEFIKENLAPKKVVKKIEAKKPVTKKKK